MTTTDQQAEAPKVLQVAEGFFVRQEVDNITWIDLGGELLVVDALEQASLEGEVFEAISRTTGGLPVKYVLNTHLHYDHVALNEAFRGRFGAEIVSQEAAPLGEGGRWFRGSRRSALMLPMPGAHTAEDCIVWCPDDSALLVGDIFGWGLIPLVTNLRADTQELLLDIYKRLVAYDARTIIPGHGPLCITTELSRWLEYYHAMREEVRRRVAAGEDDETIAAGVTIPEDMRHWWRLAKWKHADTLTKLAKSVRRGWI